MGKRAVAAMWILASLGVLWRFRQEAGVDFWAAAVGTACLAGMALALAFVRVEGGAPPRVAAGVVAVLIGAGVAVAVWAVPEESATRPPAVLCELILDESEASRRMLDAAGRRKAEMGDRLLLVVYRAGGFLRPGLAEFDPPLEAPAALVDDLLMGPRRDLAAAIEEAAGRPRLPVALWSPAGGADSPAWSLRIRNPEAREVRSAILIVDLRLEEFHDRLLWVAVGSRPGTRLEIEAGEETRIDLGDLSPEGARGKGIMWLVGVTTERMEWAELLPVQPSPSPSP